MANLRKWSQTATGNASVAGGANTINFTEGQTPGSVNNSAREMMAQVRGIYTPSEWGWVEFSATASVATQTTFKLAGNQTTDWVAPRRWRLKSGSTTRYGTIVSSSYTVETTVTVTVDSGSLSASHSLAALSPIDNLSNQIPVFRTDASGNVVAITPSIIVNSNTNFTPQIESRHAGATAGSAAYVILDRARGTYSSPTIVSSGDQIGNILFQGHDGSTYQQAAAIVVQIDTTPGAGDMPGRLIFLTTPDGSATAIERLRIDSSGNVIVTGSGGLGYGTGSGGSVTQATSKSTGVTLDKTNGVITMNNAALGGGSSVSFTFTNSTIATTDVVVAQPSNANYSVRVTDNLSGSRTFTVKNESGGSLSDALQISFAVIKVVTS